MNLNLPNDVNDFVKGLVSQGRFNSEEDAIAEGIKLLMGCEQLRKRRCRFGLFEGTMQF